jgi:hypothetical protein
LAQLSYKFCKCILEAEVERGATFLDEFLRIRMTGKLSQQNISINRNLEPFQHCQRLLVNDFNRRVCCIYRFLLTMAFLILLGYVFQLGNDLFFKIQIHFIYPTLNQLKLFKEFIYNKLKKI